jgi:hypothetical protein
MKHGGNTTNLSSKVTTIESKLVEISAQVAQVLESCNENAKSIQSFNSTILEFMQHFLYVPIALGGLGMRDHASTLVCNATHVVENNAFLKNKGKNLAIDFDASVGTNGFVGSYATFSLVNLMSSTSSLTLYFFMLELDYIFLK